MIVIFCIIEFCGVLLASYMHSLYLFILVMLFSLSSLLDGKWKIASFIAEGIYTAVLLYLHFSGMLPSKVYLWLSLLSIVILAFLIINSNEKSGREPAAF